MTGRSYPTCTMDDCDDVVEARDWCNAHYTRWRRHGDPNGKPADARDMSGETWLAVPGYEGLYEVSDLGNVYSLPRKKSDGSAVRGRMLKRVPSTGGYLVVALYDHAGKRRNINVHRVVLLAFVGPLPDGMHTRHLDGDPANSALSNLCYGTVSENAYDRVRHGTYVHNGKFKGATHCIHDHEFTKANTYRAKNGCRHCKQCQRDRKARYRAAAKAELEAA